MHRRARPAGFTLFEVIVALALIILLMSALAVFYSNALRTRDRGSKLAADAIQMRAMLDRIVDEIRHAVPLVLGDGRGFQGTKDSITIVRARLPENYAFNEQSRSEDLPPAQMDIMRVTYHLYWDEEDRRDDEGIRICYGVWRTEQRTLDPNPKFTMINENPEDEAEAEGDGEADEETVQFPQPEGELYAPEIKYLRFEYFDGMKWRDRWNVSASAAGGESGDTGGGGASSGSGSACVLPQAVRITLGRVREPPEEDEMDVNQLKEQKDEQERREHHGDRFVTVVYLPQSDQSLLSSRKKGSSDDREEMGEQTSGGT